MVIPEWLILTLTNKQLYGLIFLLGSFTVATLSDLKYMKAQAEFGEVWVLVFVGYLAYDLWRFYDLDQIQFAAKWILILLFIATSNKHIGILFKLAWGDIFACIAVMAILTPGFIVLFIVIVWLLKIIMKPVLKMFGSGDAYPFMPVVMGGTIAVLGVAIYLNPVL
jgi:hypothetical protein